MSHDVPRILVLMTTYNGMTYLREQVASVLAQRGVQVVLRVRDDNSTDGTWELLQQLAAEHENVHIARNEPNLGCVRNFMGLVYGAECEEWQHVGTEGEEGEPAATAACDGSDEWDFVALCDQDDVWQPNKLQVAAAHLDAASPQAQLYYAGVNNVDVQGASLGNEYAPYRVCAEHYGSLLLVQNWCLGCTTLMNRALVRLLCERPVYDVGRMYDAWIHAVALYCGGYVCCDLEHAYINRRITGLNTVGLMNHQRSPWFLLKKAVHWLFVKDEEVSGKHTRMARRLLEEYGSMMDAETRQLVADVAHRERDAAARRRLFARRDIRMPSATRTWWLRVMVRLGRF